MKVHGSPWYRSVAQVFRATVELRYFQLENAGTCFQYSHPKLPNCSHVGVASESMFFDVFFCFYGFVFEDEIDEKSLNTNEKNNLSAFKSICKSGCCASCSLPQDFSRKLLT